MRQRCFSQSQQQVVLLLSVPGSILASHLDTARDMKHLLGLYVALLTVQKDTSYLDSVYPTPYTRFPDPAVYLRALEAGS